MQSTNNDIVPRVYPCESMKVALVYDRVNSWGGAERVVVSLKKLFPEAQLFTSVYNSSSAKWASGFSEIKTSFLQKVPLARTHHQLLGYLMPLSFESLDLSDFELVISITSEFAKGVITQPRTKHICYCLTPTRYLWSHYNFYFNSTLLRTLSKPIISYLRLWDRQAALRPDGIIAISEVSRSRVKKFYGIDSPVVYPPALKLHPDPSSLKKPKGAPKEFFLVVSRLVPYKKVDLAIKAFNLLGRNLIIVGTGSEEKRLKSIARKNIFFTGMLTDEELCQYYKYTKALIFPQEEDFGIVAIEAQMQGKPVIAYKMGGSLETVIHKKTGIHFNRQNVESLVRAISKFDKSNFDENLIKKNANKFSEASFHKNFIKSLKSFNVHI